MNREQNIDDILKLLKDSVNSERVPDNVEKVDSTAQNISTESLQQQLKDQYISNTASLETDDTDSEYVIDSDFLSAAILQDNVHTPVAVAEDAPKDITVEELVCEADIQLESENLEDIENIESIESIENIEMPPIFEKAFEPQVLEADESEQSSVEEPEIVMHPLFMSGYAQSTSVTSNEPEEEEEEDIQKEFIAEEVSDVEEEAPIILEAPIEAEKKPTDDESMSTQEPYETFLASMRRAGVDFTSDEVNNAPPKTEDSMYLEDAVNEEILESALDAEDLDDSTVNLMMQFGVREELEKTLTSRATGGAAKTDRQAEKDAHDRQNFDKSEQTNQLNASRILSSLRAKHTQAMLSVIICAVLTLASLIYDFCPMFGIGLSGIFDYNDYPAVYVLIGLQLLVLCVAVRYKACWKGLKCAFTAAPTRDSFAILVAILTAVYDLTVMLILAFSGDNVPNLYNALAIFLLFFCALADCLELGAKMKAFEVYSSDTRKYTFVKQGATGTVSRKMYAGGLESDRAVYVTDDVTDDKSFYSELFKKNITDKKFSFVMIPLLSLGMLSSLVAIIFGADAYFSCAAFIVCVYLLLPTLFLLGDSSMVFVLAEHRLTAHGCALAGETAIEDYADMDIAVFDDLHMFKKCRTEDIGIVIYDAKVGYLALGCIDALYAKIGGPMSGMKMELPDVFRFDDVYIRRVARNGIEAMIDRRYSLVVGDTEFMQRYGLTFPPDEIDNGRSTLCVSLDGKVTAKLSVKYTTEPAFEMLVERLASVGVACAVQTFDPLISSALAARSRTLGASPVSVVHKSAEDVKTVSNERLGHSNTLISATFRTRLAEAAVWLKKLAFFKRLCRNVGAGCCAVGVLTMILLLIFGGITYINQAVLFGYILLQAAAMCALYLTMLPNKHYFTVEKMYSELERKYTKQLEREQKKNGNKEKINIK